MEPLMLSPSNGPSRNQDHEYLNPIQCILCSQRFKVTEADERNQFIKHLLEVHKLVIADVDSIPDLRKYIQYWRSKIGNSNLADFCVKLQSETAVAGEFDDYYMLCNVLLDDKAIRDKLHLERLQCILQQQQKERDDSTSHWKCLFCSETFTGNRSLVLNHMNSQHNFNVGHPDNLVNVADLMNSLENKLISLICIYCEKVFKDKLTLKEHMRKKAHKRLNPKNKEYDVFYLVNYISKDTTQKKTLHRGKGGVKVYTHPPDSDSEDEWQECIDESSSVNMEMFCLFCNYATLDTVEVFNHMKDIHDFDMKALKQRHKLTFYSQIKVINYIRRQVHDMKCTGCMEVFEKPDDMLQHLKSTSHVKEFIEDRILWDQPEYYFPTYENDNLLSALDCDDNINEDWVIPEDVPSCDKLSQLDIAPLIQDLANMDEENQCE